jgi:hypothetical protein
VEIALGDVELRGSRRHRARMDCERCSAHEDRSKDQRASSPERHQPHLARIGLGGANL